MQVITIHRSKGLEFPVVFCPFMWDGRPNPSEVPLFHDPVSGKRTIDVGHDGRDFAIHQKMELDESRGEDLRLLYVALTRAQHQAVLWWIGVQDCQHSPLARLLFDRDPSGLVAACGACRHTDGEMVVAFEALGNHVSVEGVVEPEAVRWHHQAGATPRLGAARFDRDLDVGWRRVSYSGITSPLHGLPTVGSEPEQPLTTDEEVVAPATPDLRADPGFDRLRSVTLGLADMPGGALTGTVVHSILEEVDFATPDLEGEVAAAFDRQVAWRNADLGSREAVVVGLCAAIECPLGPLVGERRLRDVERRDRLDELGFEIPLVGGDDPTGTLHVRALADLLETHLPADDAVGRYATRLRDPALKGVMRGYLTGSLDLVFRDAEGRFVLADYKTNRLALPEDSLAAWHYRPDAVQSEMEAAHYPLQALLYSVALHRYLRWRLPGYEPERHLGGVLYLFVRGMSAVEPARVDDWPCGVWPWRPPAHLVESLSDLFDRGAPT